MKVNNKKISIIYKIILCILGIFFLVAITGILDGNFNLNIFTMFTTLSNLLCIIYFIIDIIYLLSTYNDKKITTWAPLFKGLVTMSITLTLLVAHFILRMSFSFDTYSNASFLGMHYIIPIMAILDWLLFDTKGYIKIYSPVVWTTMPIIYMLVAYISAYFGCGLGCTNNSSYPYPFMDIDKLGVEAVAKSSLIIGIMYLTIGYICLIIDKLMMGQRKRRS